MSDDPWSDNYVPQPPPQPRKSRSVDSDLSDNTVEDPKESEIETFIQEENEPPECVPEPCVNSNPELPLPSNPEKPAAVERPKLKEVKFQVPADDDLQGETDDRNDAKENTAATYTSPFANRGGSSGFAGRGAFSGRGAFGRSDGDQKTTSTFGQSDRRGFNIRGGFSGRSQSAESSTFGQRNSFGRSDDNQKTESTFDNTRGFGARDGGVSKEENGFGSRREFGFGARGGGFGNSRGTQSAGSNIKSFGGGFSGGSTGEGSSTSFEGRGGFSGHTQSTESSNSNQSRGGGFGSGSRGSFGSSSNDNQNSGSSFGSFRGRGGFGASRDNSGQGEGSGFGGRGGGFGSRGGFSSSGTGLSSENNQRFSSDGFRNVSNSGRTFSNDQPTDTRSESSQFKNEQDDEDADPTRAPKGYEPSVRSVGEIVKEDEANANEYASVCHDDEDLVVTGYNGEDTRIDKWTEAGFPDELLANILRSKYNRPRKIQAAAIALIRDGYDVKGHAETGSGKTAAYLLPIIAEIVQRKGTGTWSSEVCSPLAIIIGPTRELVLQVYEQATKFAVATGVTVAKAYGQYSPGKNARDIREGCDILCATTGRLKHFVESGDVRCINVKYLVLDEADSLLEGIFIHDIRHILSNNGFPKKEDRQTMLFSATFSDSVNEFAKEILREDCAFISINKNATNKRIRQQFLVVDEHEKCNKLFELLMTEKAAAGGDVNKIRRTLVFVEAKRTSDMVAIYLSKKEIAAASINGDRGQHLREKALLEFRRRTVSVLVATDVCARGIDIPDLDHVINYDLPDRVVTYIHRVGRVGRIRPGFATSFVSPFGQDIPLLKEVKDMYCKNNTEVPEELIKLLESQDISAFVEDIGTGQKDQFNDAERNNGNSELTNF